MRLKYGAGKEMLRKFVRSFIINPELEAEARAAIKAHQAAAEQVRKAATTSKVTIGVAALGLVGFGAFLATEEGARFAGEFTKGLAEAIGEQADKARVHREARHAKG